MEMHKCASIDAGTRTRAAGAVDADKWSVKREGGRRVRVHISYSKTGEWSGERAQRRQDRLHRRITCPQTLHDVPHLLVGYLLLFIIGWLLYVATETKL